MRQALVGQGLCREQENSHHECPDPISSWHTAVISEDDRGCIGLAVRCYEKTQTNILASLEGEPGPGVGVTFFQAHVSTYNTLSTQPLLLIYQIVSFSRAEIRKRPAGVPSWPLAHQYHNQLPGISPGRDNQQLLSTGW